MNKITRISNLLSLVFLMTGCYNNVSKPNFSAKGNSIDSPFFNSIYASLKKENDFLSGVHFNSNRCELTSEKISVTKTKRNGKNIKVQKESQKTNVKILEDTGNIAQRSETKIVNKTNSKDENGYSNTKEKSKKITQLQRGINSKTTEFYSVDLKEKSYTTVGYYNQDYLDAATRTVVSGGIKIFESCFPSALYSVSSDNSSCICFINKSILTIEYIYKNKIDNSQKYSVEYSKIKAQINFNKSTELIMSYFSEHEIETSYNESNSSYLQGDKIKQITKESIHIKAVEKNVNVRPINLKFMSMK